MPAATEIPRIDNALEAGARDAGPSGLQSPRLQALGRLTGGLSHDFNNLLGVISNSAHLVQRYAADDPALAAPVAAILRAVDVGSRLTQHLTRLTHERKAKSEVVDLRHFLPAFEELLSSVVGSRIAVDIAVDGATPEIQVDAGELELAMINLALNARDAMTHGGTIALRARSARSDETSGLRAEQYVLITVADDGDAIDPGSGSAGFEPTHATCLGLSQVHAFARQSGGRSSLARDGSRTSVSLLLPAVRSNSGRIQDAPRDTRPPPAPNDAAALGGMRVLLVEDNQELGDITATLLETCGAEVQRAPDATTALELLGRSLLPDVVLTDIIMPGPMDGVAMAREIRLRHSGLPVVLISGYAGKVLPLGEFVMLKKPCNPAELVQALAAAGGVRAR